MSQCHLAEAKQASFHAKKKTNFFIYAKCPSKAITHAGTTECFLVFLILSYSSVYVRVQALLRHVCNTLMTSYGSRIIGALSLSARCHSNGQGWLGHMYWPWLVQKGHLMPKLTYHSTTIVLIFAPMLFNLPKCLLGWNLSFPSKSHY